MEVPKIFESEYKALNFMSKIKKSTRRLIKKYGKNGIYHPFYEITLIEMFEGV